MAEAETPCPQAWPGALEYGLLVECDRTLRPGQLAHSGRHRNAERGLEWWGQPLTPEQEAIVADLREKKRGTLA